MPQCEFKVGDLVRIKFIHEDFSRNGDTPTLALLRKAMEHSHRVQEIHQYGPDVAVEIEVHNDGTPAPEGGNHSFYLKPEELTLDQPTI